MCKEYSFPLIPRISLEFFFHVWIIITNKERQFRATPSQEGHGHVLLEIWTFHPNEKCLFRGQIHDLPDSVGQSVFLVDLDISTKAKKNLGYNIHGILGETDFF